MSKFNYYKLPLLFSGLSDTEQYNLKQCTEQESIDQNLELLLTTCPGEHRFDTSYGCKIWDLDFEKVVSFTEWESKFTGFIRDAIEKYELRITPLDIRLKVTDSKTINEISGEVSIRKKVDVEIEARILSTDKKCLFYYALYLGPLTSE